MRDLNANISEALPCAESGFRLNPPFDDSPSDRSEATLLDIIGL